MPLRFLVPAFLLGLASLVIPLVVHLTRRRKAQVVEFPSLMFLERVPFQAESRRRIHHWFLLLLRALAVALIVAAFARPFLEDVEVTAGVAGGPREIVILVDRSYSMGVGNHWGQAMEAARDVIREMGPLDRASLVPFARNAGVAVRSSVDRGRLLATLDTLAVSDESTSYGPALKLAQTILEETDLPGRELVLIGDFQRAGWTGEEGVLLPGGTTVTPVNLSSRAPANHSVASVSLARQRVGGRDRVTPTARLTRVGGEGAVETEAVLEVDGIEVGRREVTLPADGAASVTFDPFTVSRDFTRGAVRIAEPDDLAPDDVFFFVLSPGRAISVLVLDEGGRRGASSLFLTEALSISEENAFEVMVREGGGIAAADLAGSSVVIVNDRALPGGETAQALRGFVQDGGGILVLLGEQVRLPSELVDLLPGAYGEPRDRRNGRGGRLGYLDYAHPVFEIFRGPRAGDFTGARFFRARDFQLGESETGQILARYDDGSVALAETRHGEGRVLVWTSTMDGYWNDLAQQPVFLPFVHQLVRYASGRTESVSSFPAGQILDVTDATAMATAGLGEVAEALAGDEERVVLTPSGESLVLPTGGGPHFLRLAEQGIYELRPPGDSDVRPLTVAVNVDLGEGDLTPLDMEEVLVSLAPRAGNTTDAPVSGAREARFRLEDQERRQSLWRFLLMGAFLLLGIETLISNWVSRRGGKRVTYAGS
ncbi:MAG: BatA domain-containing protein [Longimicrobiales bacterium]